MGAQINFINIYHVFEIENPVPRITDWHREACRVMTISDHEGRGFLSIKCCNVYTEQKKRKLKPDVIFQHVKSHI